MNAIAFLSTEICDILLRHKVSAVGVGEARYCRHSFCWCRHWELLGMSYACANMVHSPGYADDLRQYTTLNMATRVPREDFPPCDKR